VIGPGKDILLSKSTASRSARRDGRIARFALCRSWPFVVCACLFSGLFSGQAAAAELDCLVKPEMYVEVSSPVVSVLEQILVETGDVVLKGQPLAKLEASVERARVKMAELQVSHTSDIENRKEQLKYKKLNNQRMQELRKKKSVPQFEADKAQTEYALAKLELAKSREIRIMARANLEMERSQLALRTILSPIDGIVVDRYAMVGESVEGRSILKLAQVNPLKVELIAPTEYFGLIKRGMKVDIYPEQPANKVFKATVTIVDKLIDPASGSFTVRMSLPNPDDVLIGGVNCIAEFAFKTPAPGKKLYSSVPSAAVVD
jgi:RND family efflux transporter MFP subunit